MAQPAEVDEQPAAKKPRMDDMQRFYRSWAWKREHRPDKDRFHRPYIHKMLVEGSDAKLTIHQQKFSAVGFASTVWDSSIVVAKYLEKHQHRYKGKRCLDLSAGCGLVGIALAKLGAAVVCTDLPDNLELLKKNCQCNVPDGIQVVEHTWGEDPAPLEPPFDVIVACDVMYIREAIEDLVKSLMALSDSATELLVAHGRNRFAEDEFKACCGKRGLAVVELDEEVLDDVYQCSDVTVYKLTRREAA